MIPSAAQVAKFAQIGRRARIDGLFSEPWITLYRRDDDEAWFSGLLAPEQVPAALETMSWDLDWSNMRPSIVTTYRGEKEVEARYARFRDEGVEPIVIARERGTGPFSVELAEDLRLFLDLYPSENGALVRCGSTGDAEVVAVIEEREVRIRKEPLLRYLAARQMYLAVFFDHVVRLSGGRSNPLPEAERYVDVREKDRAWSFGSMDDIGEPISRLCGKRLLAPPPRARASNRAEADRYAAFVIAEDGAGTPVEYSADPSALANLFGANPNAPSYLTPVHFRREVLDRYYHNPGRYRVSDGVVRNDPYWVLRIDDDHRDSVLVFLGDLGRDLPYTEQLHWRAQNVLPDGSLSGTARKRSFSAQAADGERPEHRFRAAYQRLGKRWVEAHGWLLFRPLAVGDEHLLTKLHVPASDNPAELDAQLLGLAKILVDSLNDAKLDVALGTVEPGERSLAKLERYLGARGYNDTLRDMGTLRAIQLLRSTGAVHARGSGYAKALQRLGLEGRPAPDVIGALMVRATSMLETLAEAAGDLAGEEPPVS